MTACTLGSALGLTLGKNEHGNSEAFTFSIVMAQNGVNVLISNHRHCHLTAVLRVVFVWCLHTVLHTVSYIYTLVWNSFYLSHIYTLVWNSLLLLMLLQRHSFCHHYPLVCRGSQAVNTRLLWVRRQDMYCCRTAGSALVHQTLSVYIQDMWTDLRLHLIGNTLNSTVSLSWQHWHTLCHSGRCSLLIQALWPMSWTACPISTKSKAPLNFLPECPIQM